ncbi:MAG TPA: Qat anti-phage system QueC-like protein QatC [Armatimonadota bacterium]|jgi:hypothetical protein
MRFDVSVGTTALREFAKVTLARGATGDAATLYIDYAPVRQVCPTPQPVVLDFLLLAATIYAADKIGDRRLTEDAWTREFVVRVPVSDPDLWTSQANALEAAIGFLTGDVWTFEFYRLETRLPMPRSGRVRRFPRLRGDAACLFSGGLDSLVGAIDWLEAYPEKQLVLVGHHDPAIPGPKGDQDKVWRCLNRRYPNRTRLFQMGVGQQPEGSDTNFRSRSIVFLAMGVLAAKAIGTRHPLLIPENGTISINVPLTPSRRGSCSTRTTHPYFLRGLEATLAALGIYVAIANPLAMKTKGECVRECLNQGALAECLPASVSCAKRGHTSNWVRNMSGTGPDARKLEHCGRCMPCIFRRAALHAAGMDNALYGTDICAGELDIVDAELSASDFMACLSFLRQDYSRDDLVAKIISNGPVPSDRAGAHAATVWRAMEELRHLLRDKAIAPIREAAGL